MDAHGVYLKNEFEWDVSPLYCHAPTGRANKCYHERDLEVNSYYPETRAISEKENPAGSDCVHVREVGLLHRRCPRFVATSRQAKNKHGGRTTYYSTSQVYDNLTDDLKRKRGSYFLRVFARTSCDSNTKRLFLIGTGLKGGNMATETVSQKHEIGILFYP